MDAETQARIRAAGAVQSVVASGAPIEEWRARSLYVVSLTGYVTGKLLKKGPMKPPSVPNSLQKESQ